jgi:two-component system, OmpR family, sensor histidine kinase MtrB
MKKTTSLRRALSMLTLLITAFTVLVAGALVILTTVLHHTTIGTGSSVEGVRFAMGAQIDLLMHERAVDPIVQQNSEGGLQRRLIRARDFVGSDEEASVLAEAETSVEAFFEAAHDPSKTAAERAALRDAAYGALEELVTINLYQSKDAAQEAERWDDLANALGVGMGVLVVAVAGGLLSWLRGRAFEPVLELAATMERFGRGDREARAAELGPRELREMCTRFNEMASAIAAQRQAQLTFLGGVAHDLRNPLSALKMSVAILLLDEPLKSPERTRQMVERIGRQITRMERMLEDFLDFAKIEAGLLELRIDSHDACELVEEVVELFEGMSHEHPLEVRLPDGPVPIRCDQLRIEQVITNLVSNAIKYSPPGSSVEVSLRAEADEVEVRVVDHGMGIAPQDLARIFEPFRRVGLSTGTVPGVGLGLFVVRKIIDAHAGRIEVQSTPGRGSTFRILLPAGGAERGYRLG